MIIVLIEMEEIMATNYGINDIETLSFKDGVRKRIAMYLGSADMQGVYNSIQEIISNSIDEFYMGFGKEIKIQIPPLAYHLPTFIPPLVCILQQKIRSKTGKHHLSTGNLVGLVPLPLHGQVKSSRLSA